MQEYLRRLLEDKARLKKWKKIMIALSCIVVVCTVYALSLPAQTLACDKEEHTHTAECYDENNALICEKEEHTHTDDCTKQEEVNEQEEVVKDEPETQNDDEQVSQVSEEETTTTTTETTTEPFDLNNSGKIEDIVITDDKSNSVISNGTLKPNSKFLKITVKFKDINASELNSKYGRSFSYTLPKFFRMTGDKETTIKDSSGTTDIATIRVKNGKVVITYTEEYINSGTNTTLKGDFFVEGEVDLSQLNKNDGTTSLKTPNGKITLDYRQDYLEKFGDVKVTKQWSKPDSKSDYIQYTITVTAGQDGSKNVYVVDKFTNNSQLVSYMGDISNTPQDLTTSSDGQKPYETRTTDVAGKIYLTNMQTSDNEIPKQVTDNSTINQPGSLVWSISELKSNESRTLTYFVKLSDNKNLNKQSITNTASAYTKKEGGTTYPKGKDVKTYTPNIYYNMPKTMVEKTKDDDGNYIVKYKLEFTLKSSSDYPLKNFMFYDYLNYHNIRTDETMLPYISYERDTVELHQIKDNKDTLVAPSKYKVEWEKDGTNYKADWSNSDGNPKRFRIRGTDSNPFTVYPGDSYYVTYKLKVKPEVYAAMQSNNVTINNRYIANADNAKEFDDTILNRTYEQLKLEDYKWVDKKKEATVTNQVQTINMGDSDIYVKKNDSYVKDSSVNSFKVPAGSYKYTVNVNQTMNQFDVTEATLKDTLSSDVMHYVGYVKITPYEYDATANKYVDQDPKWVKIDNETTFELMLSQIGFPSNNNGYRFEYYAQTKDLSEIGNVEVKNTFSLSDVVKGDQTFKFDVSSSQTIQVNGHYSLGVEKSAWYYENPQENATSYTNGKLYWVIEVSGSAIRKGTQIQDAISKDKGLTDSFLHSDSVAGIYQGKPANNINPYTSFEKFKNSNTGLVDKSKLFDQKFENSKHYTGTNVYSELTLTAKETISLNNDEKLYIVIMTEPQSLPSAYRAEFTYRNVALMKDISDTSFKECNNASQILFGGPNILKELGQTFTYDGKTVTTIQADHDKDNPVSKICTDLLNKTNSKGAFISWAFKVNLAGELKGNYRVLEDIPNGMELSYIRIKWHADNAGNVISKDIDGLGAEWERNSNDSTNDNGNPEKTIYYYNKNTNQALIQLGDFEAGRVGDKYAVDVQVVCRVTDDKVLLGGEEKSFTNKVTLLSGDGQTIIDTASNEATMSKRDNLSKSNDFNREHAEDNTSQTINYTITANALGQTLPLNDGNKLTLVDKLDENLELDPTTIKAKEENGNEVSIDKSYDSKTNTLEISIPNGKKVIITYSVTVKAAPGTPVDLSNKVFWKSYSENGGENDVINGFKYRLAAGGSTEGEENPQLTITKMDENKLEPIKDVKFDVYECELNGKAIKRVSSRGKISGKTDDNGIYKVDSSFITHSNTIYEVKETETPDGYVENKDSYYIIYVEKKNGVNPPYVQDCIDYFNKQDKIRYKIVDSPQKFNLVVYNTQKGITVKKQFTNNAAETKHNPVSGTYNFGLYDNPNPQDTEKPLDTTHITYGPNDSEDVLSAKFKNPDNLKGTYYVFELDQNGKPIQASAEATINSMQYKVVYESNSKDNSKATNIAKVGDTVTVTNKSRTKILPSTGGTGNLIYRMSGTALVVVGVISLSIIDKKRKKESRRKK
ncbi:SpaA isopeptide-forming pilin-related protein [uncultured Holdemanella sp.]|uniref:SpaA isopeptide-forming pilin-related protein n=1 Tax=uncultured Holdemanella sp. TaxID=1763549 RepID=UPI0025D8CB6B|nr:SpaA isopeptide-forming pilin-related protein [uncultured Holdemanella sp.]